MYASRLFFSCPHTHFCYFPSRILKQCDIPIMSGKHFIQKSRPTDSKRMLWHLVCFFALHIKEAFPPLNGFGPRKLVSHQVCSSAHMDVMCSMRVNMKCTCFIKKRAHAKSHVIRGHRHWPVFEVFASGILNPTSTERWQISKVPLTLCPQPDVTFI